MKLNRSDYVKEFILLAGIEISEDPDQPGKYQWFGSNISYHSYEEACSAALSKAADVVIKATLAKKLPYPDEYWEMLPYNQKLLLAKDAFKFSNLVRLK